MRTRTGPRARQVPVVVDAPLMGGYRYDYADAFEIRLREPEERTAEEFARAALEGAPGLLRWTIWIAQRYVLRLRLAPRSSPTHVLGWKIATSRRDMIQLEARSPLLRAVLVGRRPDANCVVITTYLFHNRPVLARFLWRIVAPLHRRVARYLMERAAASGDGSRARVPA